MRSLVALAAALLLTLSSVPATAADSSACDALRCDSTVADALANCPCPDARNHGKYVSCVARAMNKLAKDGDIPRNCKGKIKRCAARSICGKPGFVTCQVPDELGTCGTPCTADANTVCCDDATTPCAADTDCVISTKCKIKSSEERCTAIPGAVVGTATTCCADCAVP